MSPLKTRPAPAAHRAGPVRNPARTGFPGLLICLALALALAAVPLHAQGDLEGLPIREIRFVGLETQTEAAVLALMATQVGSEFSRAVVDADVARLGGSDVGPRRPGERPRPPGAPPVQDPRAVIGALFGFAGWSVEATPDGKGVIVTFEVLENRRVANVVFFGALDFDREELLPLIATRPGSYADPYTIEFDRRELLQHYLREGYAFASVEVAIEKAADGDLVKFRVTEGSNVKIRKIALDGATSFPREDLLDAMPGTDEPGWFSSKDFVFEEVQKDRTSLLAWYRGHGFLDAEVRLDPPKPLPNFEEVDLRFVVEEGRPYEVRTFLIEGLTLLDQEALFTQFDTLVGGRYEPGHDLRRDIAIIETELQALGYTEARVADESVVDFEAATVDVVLRVTEGNLTRVGDILIQNNQQTLDNVIRRELDLYTGDPLNLTKLNRGRARIRGLQYWVQGDPRGGVSVEEGAPSRAGLETFRRAYVTFRDAGEEDVKDIVIRVEEGETSRLRFAAGVGSNSGLIGDITYTKNNFDPFDWPESFSELDKAFTGGGQTLVLSLQPGPTLTRWRVFWSNPRVFDSPYGVSAEIFQILWLREDWDENRLGYALGVSRRFTEDLRVGLTLRDERVEVDDIDPDAPQIVFDFQGRNRLVTLTLDARLDRLDDFINPTSGYELRGSLEHAGLWGDIEFNKVRFDGDKYFLLDVDDEDRPYVLRVKGVVGWGAEYGGSRDIPVYERYFAGGANSLRGFEFRGVGPRDGDSPIGGKALWLASTEFHFPIFGDNLRGVLFLDSGAVGLDWEDEGIFSPRVAVGAGIRLVIPFLSAQAPLAIDFGVPLLKEDGDVSQVISFSFGSR